MLARLVDDEIYVTRLRLERVVKEDLPYLTPHDEQRWYATHNTTRDALYELLADFELQRAASLGVIRLLRDADWQRQGFQPEHGLFTAERWLAMWVEHDLTHLRQIEMNLASLRRTLA